VRALLLFAVLAATSTVASDPELFPRVQPQIIEDGHARPRAVTVGKKDGLVYVAATTGNAVYVIDPDRAAVRAVVPVGRFPDSLLALPDGRVAVVSRYEPRVDLIDGSNVTRVDVGPEAGHRGLAFDARTQSFYLASPAIGAIRVFDAQWKEKQRMPAGLFPRTVQVHDGRLYATDFNGHTLTAWAISPDGRIGARLAQVTFHAPPTEIVMAKGSLFVLTHEDRDVDRREVTVWYLDSVLAELDPATLARRAPDRNVTELRGTAKLDGGAFDAQRGRVAFSGGATDDVLVLERGELRSFLVGPNPQGVAFDARGRIWVADRLGDAVSSVDPASGEVRHVTLGARAERRSLAELGEVLYYSRDLVPNNVADGPKSVYACSACHEEAHIDGRLHPAKRNRFRSMTKSDRGIATTPPYLSLGELANLTEFADNIISSHAQGWETNKKFDQYSVRARTGIAGARVLSAVETRRAMAYYMATIPTEPNPLALGHLDAAAERGAKLFLGHCTRCHLSVGNVALGNRVPRERFIEGVLRGEVALAGSGLVDAGTPVLGTTGNNPPSLRGIWSTAPYFSDGSARTLDEVVARTDPEAQKVHAPANHSPFTRDEQDDLVAFLHSL
jgi:DNA-binding beta-propeller fold protein YncE